MADEKQENMKSNQRSKNFVAKIKSGIAKSTAGTSSNSEELAGRVLALVRYPPVCKANSEKLIAIRRLLQKGAPPDHFHSLDQMTALHIASFNGDYFAAKELIDFGAVVNVRDGMESTPLHLAARRGWNNVIQLLIESGSNINLQNRLGETALHEAAVQECRDTIRILLNHDANTEVATGFSLHLQPASPFAHAVRAGRLECILVFLQYGETLHRFCPLPFLQRAHKMCMNLKILELFIEAGLRVHPSCDHNNYRVKFSLWPEEFFVWLDSPRPLSVLCRQIIRNILGHTNLRKADKLPLPQTVKDRLSYHWPDTTVCVNLCTGQKKHRNFNIYHHKLPCGCI